jgi:hypothetical protein
MYIHISAKDCAQAGIKAEINNTKIGSFALQLINGKNITVKILSFLLEIDLVANIAGTVQPNHKNIDKNHSPESQIFFNQTSKT